MSRGAYHETEADIWMLSRADHEALEGVRDELWAWLKLASTGGDVLALGAALNALELILEREEAGCGVQLSLSERPEGLDGVEIDSEISDEGIKLGQTEFVATGQGRSCDHHCETMTRLDRDGSFEVSTIRQWIKLAGAMRGREPELRSSIDHLPDYS